MPPSVSILIPTYARVRWLEEALFCAVHQDYGGDIEVVVESDCPRQRLTCDHPAVTVVNSPVHATLGAKRNAMIDAVRTDYFVWLDDDDLALPWYVDRLVRPLGEEGAAAVLSTTGYMLRDGAWELFGRANELLCDRGRAREVGGYPDDLDCGEDQVFRQRLQASSGVVSLDALPAGYVYRWGQGTFHISGIGVDRNGNDFRQDADGRLDRGEEPSGTIVLQPRLHGDYFGRAPDEVRSLLPVSFLS
jgi:glycosyltransferase involved in cell wall biosynthesis